MTTDKARSPGRIAGGAPSTILATIAFAIALLISACGADDAIGGAGEIVADGGATIVVANSPQTISTNGPQRVLVALIGDGVNQFLGGPDDPAVIQFRSLEGETADEVPGEWLSAAGVSLGLYVAHYDFDQAGVWEVKVKSDRTVLGTDAEAQADSEEEPYTLIQVAETSSVPDAGQPAPRSETLTAASVDSLGEITTDTAPNLDFYQLSVADAVENGRPTVVIFATPAFCQTAICGPTIEIAKDVADGTDGVDFVHVEPFDIEQARNGSLLPIDAMTEWGLVTEPWVFVIDGDGDIAASFEGIVGGHEISSALADL